MRFVLIGLTVMVGMLLTTGDLTHGQASSLVITIRQDDTVGAYLVDGAGRALYIFSNDSPHTSECQNICLGNWPPVTLSRADMMIDAGVLVGQIGILQRTDTGESQVTYGRMPLYNYILDSGPGDIFGLGVDAAWRLARPQTVIWGGSDALGSFLVSPTGMTLYTFNGDQTGISNCSAECIDSWPPLTVASRDQLAAGFGAAASAYLDLIERPDTGQLQVTYQGMPLYTFVGDQAPGDAQGQGAAGAWFVVQPALVGISQNDELGQFLASSDGTTLYIFANDTLGSSACSGLCASLWPPLIVHPADALLVEADINGVLGTIVRDDGTSQVTYAGHPLYSYVFDQAPGETAGHGTGEVWFAALLDGVAAQQGASCVVTSDSSPHQRSGPGTEFSSRGAVGAAPLALVGQAVGTDGVVWWKLENGSWVRSDLVSESGDCDVIAVVAAPQLPATAVPTQEPVAQQQSAPPAQAQNNPPQPPAQPTVYYPPPPPPGY